MRLLLSTVAVVAVGAMAVAGASKGIVAAAGLGVVVTAATARWPRWGVPGWLVVAAAAGGPALSPSWPAGIGQIALIGSITVGFCLGHWFLVDPHLPRWPLRFLAITGVSGVVVVALATWWGPQSEPLLGPLTTPVAIAAGIVTILVLTASLAALAVPTYKGVQSATGLFYVATMSMPAFVFLMASLRVAA